MADIYNERDWTLQHAAFRTIEIEPPAAVIIPGYTGLSLTPDYHMFVSSFGKGLYAINGQIALTATRKGIPTDVAVNWDTGAIFHLMTTDPNTAGKTLIPAGTPGLRFTPAPGAAAYWGAGVSNIILSETGDPLTRLVRDVSYPLTQGANTKGPSGVVRVSATYGGQLFQAFAQVSTFYG